jgi:hypothetical protein
MKDPQQTDYLMSMSASAPIQNVDYFVCMGWTSDREELKVHRLYPM